MYTIRSNGHILRLSDMTSIPPDPMNRDYRKYLDDVARGVEVEREPPHPQVADRQTKLAEIVAKSRGDLNRATDLDAVKRVILEILDGLVGLDS